MQRVVQVMVLLSLLLSLVLSACESPPRSGRRGGISVDGREVRSTSDLPITRVVLYRSGIAYVERQGQVEGDRLRLQIRPDQINDILTTLTVIVDGGENLAASIGLPIERSIAQDLDQLPAPVRQQGGMQSLLVAFRGASATISTRTSEVTGRIVGTEGLTNDDGNLVRRVTLLSDEGTLHQIRIDEITNVNLHNEAIEVGLAKSLDVSLGEGDWKPVELTINLSGQAPHEVFISYVVSMPTWKPTYRIIVQENEALHLQGWAVVDNLSGEDWGQVSLSLVAGTPISFRYDLHSPRFVSRPDLTSRGFVDELAMVAPTVDSSVRVQTVAGAAAPAPRRSASDSAPSAEASDRMGRPRDRARSGRAASGAGSASGARADWDEASLAYDPPEPAPQVSRVELDGAMMVESVVAEVSTEQFDNLFRYDVGYRVTVPDRESALVTILNAPLEGEDVLYFDPASPSAHAANAPYRSVRLVNTSQFTVERGPLSIFKDGTFVGQAIAPRIGQGEMLFLPYSVDGRFRIDARQESGEEQLRLTSIISSQINCEALSVDRRLYQVTNNSGETARLYIRVPKRVNWNLRTPDPESAGVIDQGAVWYVPVDLASDLSREFVVEQTTRVSRNVSVWSAQAVEAFGFFISNPDADREVAPVLEQILERVHRVGEISNELRSRRARRDDLSRRASDLRANLRVLAETRQARQLRRDLERRLGEVDRQSTELAIEIDNLQQEESQSRAEVATMLMDLSLTGISTRSVTQ